MNKEGDIILLWCEISTGSQSPPQGLCLLDVMRVFFLRNYYSTKDDIGPLLFMAQAVRHLAWQENLA